MKCDKDIKSLTDIPHKKYVGYFWGSGDTEPILVDNEYPDFTKKSDDSLFIQEGMLWNAEEGISIMINYTDKQRVNCYRLSKETLEKIRLYNSNKSMSGEDRSKFKDFMTYESNRLDEKKLSFLQYWKEEEDIYCNNLPVLKMKAQIFIGFNE